MNLASFLFRHDRRSLFTIVALGVLGGLAGAALVAVVNRALHNPGQRAALLAIFAFVVLVKIASHVIAGLFLVRLSQSSVQHLLDELTRRVLETPLRRLEEIGSPRVLAALTDDAAAVASGVQTIPTLTLNVAVLIGCTVYLSYLSWAAAAAMLAFAAVGALVYRALLRKAHQAVRLAHDGRDRLFGHLRALTDGIKELKLSGNRRESFLDEDFRETLQYVRRHMIIAKERHVIADGWSQAIFYLLMATMLFGLAGVHGISSEALSGYVFTALYAAAPIFGIIAVLPVLHRGQAALDRIATLGLTGRADAPRGQAPRLGPPALQFRSVRFSYFNENGAGEFALGPVDLTIEPGELIFVVGGNGSGKTTFVKLLTGLYLPTSGEIRVNGQVLQPNQYSSYRELFAAVYSDFFLFTRLPPLSEGGVENKGALLLEKLGLSHKVRIVGRSFSTTALSQGQRRRLALLSAYLEDRPVYVLDEWAADQDPSYRQMFYTTLLPELKARGKTVIVVTHDDRYFHLGDKIVKLEYGQPSELKRAGDYSSQAATESDESTDAHARACAPR